MLNSLVKDTFENVQIQTQVIVFKSIQNTYLNSWKKKYKFRYIKKVFIDTSK